MSRLLKTLALGALCAASSLQVAAQAPPTAAAPPAQGWIAESNKHAQVLLDIIAKYGPEQASFIGVEGHDAEVFDAKPQNNERQAADLAKAIEQLRALHAAATDPLVKQDLDILIEAAVTQRDTILLNDRLMLPYFDFPRAIYGGFQNLMDERVPQERQKHAVQRLKRYAGLESGYEPITELVKARYAERAGDAAMVGPWVVEVEANLDNQKRYVKGIRDLFAKSKLKGWQKPLATFEKQLAGYETWVRETVVPRARKTNQLPPEIYADNLKNFGVPMEPKDLIERAQLAFLATRDEMDSIARQIAKERGWKDPDYRAVIRELKKDRLPSDKVLEIYRGRLEDIEEFINREKLVTLPSREAVIRLGNEAESAAQPAPHIDPPRLIGNTGEPAEFVLPLVNPSSKSGVEMDDFIYQAITWSLTAHEARPGHELQFAKMLERGVSTARVVFAFNSANVEGWALYAEAFAKQYEPLEGQLGALQMRLMRAARAFLDPMLNLGMLEPDAAKRLLMEEVMLSEPMAKQEVDRYTFRAPGQATAYFYGYSKLQALRTRAELALNGKLDVQAYHDYIVNQGLLPLDLLEKAVLEEFVPSQRKGP